MAMNYQHRHFRASNLIVIPGQVEIQIA